MGEILQVKNISVRFKEPILEDISFSVMQNEIFGIIGVSGAGKTSLLNAIAGYYPTTGKVIYNGDFRKAIGFSSQKPSVYKELTVLQNLKYFAGLYKIPGKIKDYNIKKVLSIVHLDGAILAKNLSGGMLKRLDIACAIVHRPLILLLDETTGDMDFILRKEMWKLVKDINKTGTTIILASHFLSEIEELCDRIGILSGKKMEFKGTIKELKNMYPQTHRLDQLFENYLKDET